jgi:hypothetical protein
MGLLKHLLFWPVTGPQFLIDFSLRRVQGVVHQELTDDTGVKSELMELQLLLELGDIDEAEYERRERELMAQLREIREWREQLGMGVSGGLVRVAGSGESGADETAEAENQAAAAGSAESAGPGPTAGTGPTDPAAGAADDRPGQDRREPGIADPGSATIDIHFDWDE